MAKESEHTKRKVLEGANLALYTLVVIAIVVVANWFVSNHDRHWDLTPSKSFSLSPETQKILRGLDREVTIYAFDHKEALREGRDLLQNYAQASHHVTVRYVDPDREPGLAKEFGVRTYGTVVVASGDRHYESEGGATEEGLTNALIHVLHGQKTIYFSQGHGERDLGDTDRAGYDRFKKALGNESYEVKTLTLLQKNAIPSDCVVLVIAGPRTDYLPVEVDTIKTYVDDGGRLMLLMDPAVNLPNLSKLLADWNVTPQNDLVIDQNPAAQLFGTSPAMPLIILGGSNPIVAPLARTAAIFPFTRSFEVGKDPKPGLTSDALCQTTDASFGVADYNDKMQQVSFRPGKDYKGPLTVAVSGEVKAPGANSTDKQKQGRFIVLGTSALPSNVYLNFQADRDLIMNMVNWLSAEEDLISIRPKPPAAQHLNMTQRQMSQLLYLGVIGLPLVVVLIGITVWWERRR